jgi:hypothetical protein
MMMSVEMSAEQEPEKEGFPQCHSAHHKPQLTYL